MKCVTSEPRGTADASEPNCGTSPDSGERWAQAERAYYLRVELGIKAEHWIAFWGVARDVKGGMVGMAR